MWGAALIAVAALAAWAFHALNEAYWAAARERTLLYAGIPAGSIASWFLMAALLSGAAGLVLLLPALIARVPRKVARRVTGWAAALAALAALPFAGVILVVAYLGAFGAGDTVKVVAADGQAVLVTQDGFDGDSVDIYRMQDEFHYKWARSAPEIAGWPRVKDQDCHLDTADGELLLTCGPTVLVV